MLPVNVLPLEHRSQVLLHYSKLVELMVPFSKNLNSAMTNCRTVFVMFHSMRNVTKCYHCFVWAFTKLHIILAHIAVAAVVLVLYYSNAHCTVHIQEKKHTCVVLRLLCIKTVQKVLYYWRADGINVGEPELNSNVTIHSLIALNNLKHIEHSI